MNKQPLKLLVGDNAFHGISHLSQQRARDRSIMNDPSNAEYAAQLVKLSLQNGANGFMFSVSEKTLSILKSLNKDEKPELYAIVPYAFEYVRLATRIGGISGLAKKVARDIIFSRNIITVAPSVLGLIRADPKAFLKIYLIYEISRIKSAAGKGANLKSVLLHEVITDMALGLDLDWFFKYYIKFFSKSKTRPGFETRNFPYLVQKFKEWHIDMNNLIITCSFNKIGFQMNPSQAECEKTLKEIPPTEIIAMSVLAAGYLKPFEAVQYIAKLSNISHIVVGVSKESQARETFKFLESGLDGKDSR
jgi:hypothetical protein